jgi:hypothetical protein
VIGVFESVIFIYIPAFLYFSIKEFFRVFQPPDTLLPASEINAIRPILGELNFQNLFAFRYGRLTITSVALNRA